jgi:hypothetical protein
MLYYISATGHSVASHRAASQLTSSHFRVSRSSCSQSSSVVKSPHPLESAAQLSWRDLRSPKTQLEIEEACTIYKGKIQESKTSSKEEEMAAASVKLGACSPITLVAARSSCWRLRIIATGHEGGL